MACGLYALVFGLDSPVPRRPVAPLSPAEAALSADLFLAGVRRDKAEVDLAVQALDWMHPTVRRTAAMALGRMESPRALPALRRALNHVPQSQPDIGAIVVRVPGDTAASALRAAKSRRAYALNHRTRVTPAVRVAIARIKTGPLHGTARVIAFETVFLMTSPDPLADRFCPDRAFLDSIADILVAERSRGCHVAWMAPCFRLDAGQRMRVALARTSSDDRVKAMLGEVAGRRVVRMREACIARALRYEGPVAAPLILERLSADARASRFTTGDGHLMWTLSAVGGRESVPMLKAMLAITGPASRYAARELRFFDKEGRCVNPYLSPD